MVEAAVNERIVLLELFYGKVLGKYPTLQENS